MDVDLVASHVPTGSVNQTMEATKLKLKTERPDAYAVGFVPGPQSVVPMAGPMHRTVMLLSVQASHQ